MLTNNDSLYNLNELNKLHLTNATLFKKNVEDEYVSLSERDKDNAEDIEKFSLLKNAELAPHINSLQAVMSKESHLFPQIHLGEAIKGLSDYEGMETSPTTNFLCNLLNIPGIDAEAASYVKLFESLNKYSKRLEAVAQSTRMEVANNRRSSEKERIEKEKKFESDVDELAKDTAVSVSKLAAGESYLMEGGWTHPGGMGHRMLYQFKKNDDGSYNILVYQTDLIENENKPEPCPQGETQGAHKKKIIPFTYYEKVPFNEIFFSEDPTKIEPAFFKKLICLNIYPLISKYMNSMRFKMKHVIKIFEVLDKYKKAPPEFLQAEKTPQHSGSCSWHSVKTALLGLISHNFYQRLSKEGKSEEEIRKLALYHYKAIMFKSKLYSMIAQYKLIEEHQNIVNTLENPMIQVQSLKVLPELRTQLKEAARNFARHIAKLELTQEKNPEITEQDIRAARCTVKDILKNLGENSDMEEAPHLETKPIEFSAKVDNQENERLTKESALKLEQVLDEVRKKATKLDEIQPLTAPVLLKIESPGAGEINQFLQKHLQIVKNLKEKSNSNTLLNYIEAVIGVLPLPGVENVYLKSLGEQEANLCIDAVAEFSSIYASVALSSDRIYPSRTQNTHMMMTIMLFELAKCLDQHGRKVMQDYGLHFGDFEKIVSQDPYYVIDSIQDKQRREEILKYCQEQKNSKHFLGNFRDITMDASCEEIKFYRKVLEGETKLTEQLLYWKEKKPEYYANFEKMGNFQYLALLSDFGDDPNNVFAGLLNKHNYRYLTLFKRVVLHNYFIMGAGEKRTQGDFDTNSYKVYFDNSKSKISLCWGQNSLTRELYIPEFTCGKTPFTKGNNAQLEAYFRMEDTPEAKNYQKQRTWIEKRDRENNSFVSFNENSEFSDIEQQLLRAFCEPKLIAPTLLLVLKKYPEYLDDAKARISLMLQLFHPVYDDKEKVYRYPLIDELQQDQNGFWNECSRLIIDGLRLNYDLHPKSTRKISQILFFLRLSSYLTDLYKQIHGRDPAPLMGDRSEIDLINQLFTIPSLNQQQLFEIHVHRLQHYSQKDVGQFKEKEWMDIYTSWIFIQSTSREIQSSIEDPHQLSRIRQWMFRIEPHLQTAVESEPTLSAKICDAILSSQKLEELSVDQNKQNTKWSGKKFPIFTGDNTLNWEINLRDGKIQNKFGALKTGAKVGKLEWNQANKYKRLFGNRKFDMRELKDSLSFQDSLYPEGERLFMVVKSDFENGIQRCISGKWYRYVHFNDLDLQKALPQGLIADYSHWAPVDSNDNTEMLITDLKSGKLFAIVEKGTHEIKIVSKNPVKTIERHHLNLPSMTNFEKSDYILLLTNGAGLRETVLFPRFVVEGGSSLEFNWDAASGRWVYAQNHNYYLAQHPKNSPLGSLTQCLCLCHKNGKEFKYLVPKEKFGIKETIDDSSRIGSGYTFASFPQNGLSAFHEINIRDGEFPRSDTEGTLFLCYLFLFQRDYKKALSYLNQIAPSDTLSESAVSLLKDIYSSTEQLKDFSGNACALRLHAYLKYKSFFPIEVESEEIQKTEKQLRSYYRKYLKSLNNVDSALHLNDDELELCHLLKIKPGPRLNVLRKMDYDIIRTAPKSGSDNISSWDKTPIVPLEDDPYIVDYGIFTTDRKEHELEPLMPGKKYPLYRFKHDYEILHNASPDNAAKRRSLAYELSLINNDVNERSEHTVLKMLLLAYRFPDEAPKFPVNIWEGTSDWKKNIVELSKRKKGQPRIIPPASEPKVTRTKVHYNHEAPFESFAIKRRADLQLDTSQGLNNHDPDLIVNAFCNEKAYFTPIQKSTVVQRKYANDSLAIKESELSDVEKISKGVVSSQSKFYADELVRGVEKNYEEALNAYVIPEKENLEKLKHDLTLAKETCIQNCKQFEKLIYKCLNLPPAKNVDERANRLELITKDGKIIQSSTLMDCYRAIALSSPKDNNAASNKALRELNPHLNDDECAKIRHITIHYLMEDTVRSQLVKASENIDAMFANGASDLEKLIYWRKACDLLFEKRLYQPLNDPKALLFEKISGLRIRQNQIKLINDTFEKLFLNNNVEFAVVFQLIMGGGKTSVILSQLMELASNADKVPLFLCHHSQYSSVVGNLKEFQKTRYNKDIIPIEYSRKDLASKPKLEHLLKTLTLAKAKKNPIIMKTTMLQVLELEFLSLSDDFSSNNDEKSASDEWERLKLLNQILNFISNNCAGVLDEIDLNLNILQGVHFPKGVEKFVTGEHILHVRNIFSLLATDPELNKLVGLQQNRQAELTLNTYKTKVMPRLAALLKQNNQLLLNTKELQESFERYATGKITSRVEEIALQSQIFPKQATEDEINDIKFLRWLHLELPNKSKGEKEAAALITLSKQILTSVLHLTLGKSNNRSYGRAPFSDDKAKVPPGKIIPYLGVGTPATTEFGYIYEAICYHFQTVLNEGNSAKHVNWYAQEMTEIANRFAIAKDGFAKTEAAKIFKALTGINLEDAEDPTEIERAVKNINADPLKQLQLESEIIKHTLTYHSKILSSSSISIIDRIKKAIGASGTINPSTLHTKLQSSVEMDKGTEGKIIDVLLDRFERKQTAIHQVDNEQIETILGNASSNNAKKDKIYGLVDTGGLLKCYDNLTVAQKVLEYYKNDNRIQAVLFFYRRFDPQSKQFKESFALLKKGAEHPVPINNTRKDEITKLGLTISQIFTYYDELRGTGTDIPQPPEAINLVTVDPQNILIQRLLQGIARLRELFLGQNVDLVVLKNSAKDLFDKGSTMTGLLKTAIKNHAIQIGKQTYRTFLEQINQYFRVEINKILQQEIERNNQKEFKSKFLAFDSLIFTKFEDKPFEQYRFIENEISPLEALKIVKSERLAQFKKAGASDEQIKSVTEAIDELLKYVEKAMAPENTSLPSKVTRTNSNLPSELHVEVSLNKEQEKDKERESELEKELQNELTRYSYKPVPTPAKEIEWGVADSFDELKKPKIFGLKNVLKEGFQTTTTDATNTVVVSEKALYQTDFSRCFPDHILMTENFRFSTTHSLPIFHPFQKSANHVVVQREANGKLKFILLSMHDASFLRTWIAAKKPENVWLLNADCELIESQGNPLPDKNDSQFYQELHEGMGYVNLLEGRVDNLVKDIPLCNKLFEQNKDNKLHFLKLKIMKSPLQKKLFLHHPFFNPKMEEDVLTIPKPAFVATYIEPSMLVKKMSRAKHLGRGLAMTMLSPLIFLSGLIRNVALLIFRTCQVCYAKDKTAAALRRNRQARKTVADPALVFIHFVEIFNPEKYLKLQNQLQSYIDAEAISA